MLKEKEIYLYEVNITFVLSDETKAKILNDGGDEYQTPEEIPDIEGTFHIGAENLIDATMIAQEYCTKEFSNGFYIISISEMREIFLANWPTDDDPLDWDDSTPPEELMSFECICGTEIVLRNNNWKFFVCSDCDKIIDRNHIIENSGKFLFIDME